MVKKAVLVGINYPGTQAELRGCINDVRRIYETLVDRYGFDDNNIDILIDTDPSSVQPTGTNIRKALRNLVSGARPGDVLFFHYSGHGVRVPCQPGDPDNTGFDECIVPSDMNLITDDDFREFVNQVPAGVPFTLISDSCHSGGLIDNAKEQIGESSIVKKLGKGKPTAAAANKKPTTGGKPVGGKGKGKRDLDMEDVHGEHEGELQLQGGGDASTDNDDSHNVFHKIHNKLRKHGITLHLHQRYNEQDAYYQDVDYEGEEDLHFRSRALPLSTLVDILRERSGKSDMNVEDINSTLYGMFQDESSLKVKRIVKGLFDVGHGYHREKIKHLATKIKNKLKDDGSTSDEEDDQLGDNEVQDRAMKGKPARPSASGAKGKPARPSASGGSGVSSRDMGVLVSGCQSSETSADASGSGGEGFGAMSNAIQTVLGQTPGPITNRDLVSRVRQILRKQGYSQHPGLYCSDENANAPFIC